MSVHLRRQRDGSLRPEWYGEYVDRGKRKVVNLGIPWRGTPPGALLHPGKGDDTPASLDFDESRKEAEKELAHFAADARRKGRAGHLTERLIEEKTGRSVEHVRIDQLPKLWRAAGREAQCVEKHLKTCDARFRRLIDFMRARAKPPAFLYEVTAEDAASFVESLQTGKDQLARSTAHATVRLVNAAFRRFLPVGVHNPFSTFLGRRGKQTVEIIHRRPFTPAELQRLFAAREDAFMHPLVVAAACTGMRRSDVCALKWSDVDLGGGMVTVKTSKTGETVEVPIFGPLHEVLKARRGTRTGYVFPEAAAMLHHNPQGLTYRFKTFVVRALATKPIADLSPPRIQAADVKDEGVAAILDNIAEGERRERTLDSFRRYCCGQSVRAIHKTTGRAKSQISYDLHTVERLIGGKAFMRSGQAPGIKAEIATMTRAVRKQGQKAASILDWHALRTTWVTLALSAGVPMELVRRVTGHATVEVVLRHYFKPGREHFRSALARSLPEVLTGSKPAKVKPAEELVALAGKVAAGTASKEEKNRLRLLAAKV